LVLLLLLGILPLGFHPVSRAAGSDFTLTFPQIANGVMGGGSAIRSGVLLINNTDHEASGSLAFYGDDGTPMALNTDRGTGNNFSFTLDSGQVFRLETDGKGPLVRGWARVVSNAQLSGSGTFTVLDSNGNILSEVGVGDSPPASRLMILAEATRDTSTAFAICNPDVAGTAHLVFGLRSLDGSLVTSKTIELKPLAHLAEYVTQTFGGTATRDFTGVLAVSSDLPVSLVTLRALGDNYTSLPSVPTPAAGQVAQDLIFPRIGDGVFGDFRFQTTFLLFNNSSDSRTATLELFNGDGTAMTVTIGSVTASRFTVTIPALGAARLVTDGRSSPGVLGWARMTSGSPVGAGAIFATFGKDGSEFVSEVGVAASSAAEKQTIYVREKEGSATGLALSNVSSHELTARLRLYSDSASPSPLAETTLKLSALSGLGKFVSELFPSVPEIAANNFEGRLGIESWISRFGEDILCPLAGLTLLARGSRYTSLPAVPYRPDSRPLSAFDARVSEVLAQMTLDEKVGQMTQAERGALSAGDIGTYLVGSVLSGGGSGPAVNDVGAWADMVDGFQSQALKTRMKIPILYGIDAVHGHNNVRGAVIFPHNIGLGATRNRELVRMAARITASEVRATGINWTFSPVVAVPRDKRWGRTYEGFGEDPDLVREMGKAAVLGFQGAGLADPSNIVACAKHYLGDGGTTWGTGNPVDQGDTRVDEVTLRRIHLPGYLGAMESGVGTIMVSFSSWNGQKMTGNHYLLTDVLKGELGFEGFLVSDWAAINQLPFSSYRDQVKAAINAGIDMGMVPSQHREFFIALKSLVQTGEVPISRIDDAVRRILRVKFAAGLFDRSPLTDRSYQARFGSNEHREVAREAVRQSLVLLKNDRSLLPLPKSFRRVFVAGTNANDLGHQCGGWTISWQGGNGDITTGTTILQAIRQAVSPTTQVTYSQDGTGAGGADVGIVVIGESPYAEGPGDNGTLSLSAQDIAAIDNVKGAGIPIVVILISGRPLILGTALDKADSFLAAWLPGTEGRGVADVLFGDYSPTGKLPCSWPRSLSQIPINLGDPGYDPLFPYGFGLTY
jgi:beta-glucosidase